MTFHLRKATLVVDSVEDAQAATRLNMPAVLYGDLVEGRARLTGQALVVSGQGPLEKTRELVARGVSNADVRFVDMGGEFGLPSMAAHQIDRLRWLFSQPISVLGDRVRPLHQWPAKPAWQPWDFGDPDFNEFLRWRPRNLAVVVGDEGSGKSTFSQILAMKLLTGPTLWPLGVRASVCAWEDDLEVFRDMVFKFCPSGLQERIYWFEPDNDPDRLLDEYLTNVEYLSRHEGVRLHIADPWNAFNHDPGGETETKYVQRMLLEMQKLTRALDVTIIVVTHLPKRPGRGLRPFGLADAASSKEFANKADMGFCIANTGLLGLIPGMAEEKLKLLRLSADQVATACARGEVQGKEHMIVVTDKVKVRGMDGRGMGKRTVRAFTYDREECSLKLDSTATELAKLLWD